MAERLASIFGTEKDKVNCPFYFKIGACRHGDRCSRLHNKPHLSPTILVPNMYQNPALQMMALGQPCTLTPEEMQGHFDDFFDDVYSEMSNYGEVEEMHVLDNLGDHMNGNLYCLFETEDAAQKAVQALNGRFYAGRSLLCEFSPVTDFREARCRQFDMGECTRGGFCNFMHLRQISPELETELFPNKKRYSPGRGGGRGRGGRGGRGRDDYRRRDDYDRRDYDRRGRDYGRDRGHDGRRDRDYDRRDYDRRDYDRRDYDRRDDDRRDEYRRRHSDHRHSDRSRDRDYDRDRDRRDRDYDRRDRDDRHDRGDSERDRDRDRDTDRGHDRASGHDRDREERRDGAPASPGHKRPREGGEASSPKRQRTGDAPDIPQDPRQPPAGSSDLPPPQ